MIYIPNMNTKTTTKTFTNTAWTKRDYECINIVACQADVAPGPQWVEAAPEAVRGLTMLYRQAGVTYFGHM